MVERRAHPQPPRVGAAQAATSDRALVLARLWATVAGRPARPVTVLALLEGGWRLIASWRTASARPAGGGHRGGQQSRRDCRGSGSGDDGDHRADH